MWLKLCLSVASLPRQKKFLSLFQFKGSLYHNGDFKELD